MYILVLCAFGQTHTHTHIERPQICNLTIFDFDFVSSSASRTVIDTLKSVEDDRKCFRLIGGVLCERTVKSVLPQLNDAKEQLEKLIAQRQEQLTAKGIDINKFREKHNIKIKGEGAGGPIAAESAVEPTAASAVAGGSEENRNHVLVAN